MRRQANGQTLGKTSRGNRRRQGWLRLACCLTCGMALLGLSACSPTGGMETAMGNSTPPPGTPPALRLNTAYQEHGVTIIITSFTRQINPATVPFDPADRPPSQHFVRLDVTLHNTTGQRWDVEARLQTTTSGGGLGGFVDLAPVVINGQQVYMKPANLDALNLIDADQTVQRSVYYLINPDLTTMALYLNIWTPGQRNFTNLPQLCLVNVSAQ